MTSADIFSYCVSIGSIAVAVWQTNKNANLKKYIKSDAMELHRQAGMLLGSTQSCLTELKTGGINGALQDAGKAEGLAQALFQRSIKNIHHHSEYTRKDIEAWIKNGKIEEHHKASFLNYAER